MAHVSAPGWTLAPPEAARVPSTPGSQFRSSTLSPRGNRGEAPQPAASSPLIGPSRRSQLSFPSFEPVHIGATPMSKAPSYTGQPPARAEGASRQRQMQGSPLLQAPGPGGAAVAGCQSQAGFAAPSRGPAAVAAAAKRQEEANVGPEEVVFLPAAHTPRAAPGGASPGHAHTPRTSGCAPGAAPRRGLNGGQQTPQQMMQQPQQTQQSFQPQRQFATSLSPRVGHRETKPNCATTEYGLVGDENYNCENTIGYKERRDSAVKLQEASADQAKLREANAKLAELSARLVQKEQVFEQAAASQREAQALHERLRAELEEARLHVKRKDTVEVQLQHLEEEKAARLAELAQARGERKELREQCAGLEAQNVELQQRLRSLERHQAKADQGAPQQAAQNAQELEKAAQSIRELESLVHDKDQRLHEMDCLIHDKDQTLQQLRHEQQKQDAAAGAERAATQAQLQDLQVELGEARRRREAEREQAAKRAAAAEEAARLAAEKDASQRAEELVQRAESKEIRNLRQKLQHQRHVIESLESQLRKTGSVASLMTPGELGRMMKSEEAKNHFSEENARLFSRNSDLETDNALVRKENALLRRRLPAEVCEALRREAASWAAGAEEPGAQPLAEPSP